MIVVLVILFYLVAAASSTRWPHPADHPDLLPRYDAARYDPIWFG